MGSTAKVGEHERSHCDRCRENGVCVGLLGGSSRLVYLELLALELSLVFQIVRRHPPKLTARSDANCWAAASRCAGGPAGVSVGWLVRGVDETHGRMLVAWTRRPSSAGPAYPPQEGGRRAERCEIGTNNPPF